MAKIIRTLVIAAVVVGLMVGSMGSVFAAEPSFVPAFVGTVVEKGEINNNVTALPQFVYRPQLLVKKTYMELPPKQIKKIWRNMPPYQIKKIWIHLKPETD